MGAEVPGGMSVGRLGIIKADITELEVECIVNAANRTLLGGGGVDGAIHAAAGPGLLEECRKLGGCPTGEARLTRGYNLRARWVIHTVGPIWRGGGHGEDGMLASCYRNSLRLAAENGISEVAFPSISTGAYGFPVGRAAAIAVREILGFLEAEPGMERVLMVCFGDDVKRAYENALERTKQK